MTSLRRIVLVAHLTKASQFSVDHTEERLWYAVIRHANEMTRPPFCCARCMWNLIPNLSHLSSTAAFGTISCRFIPAIYRTQRMWSYSNDVTSMWVHASHGDAKSSQIKSAAEIAGSIYYLWVLVLRARPCKSRTLLQMDLLSLTPLDLLYFIPDLKFNTLVRLPRLLKASPHTAAHGVCTSLSTGHTVIMITLI